MTLKRLYSYAGSLPSTERCKWRPLRSPENLQWTFKNTPIKTFSALLRKFQGNPQSFCSRSVEPLKFRKTAQTKRINSTPFSRKWEKIDFFDLFYWVTKFPICEILTWPPCQCVLSMVVKVRTKSQFTISRKKEIRVLPYGRPTVM